jgi:hypothetical protein
MTTQSQIKTLDAVASYLIDSEAATAEQIESIHNPGCEASEWLADAQRLVGHRALTQAIEACGAGYCELCIRATIVSLSTTERPIDHEYISGRKVEMPVCDACAGMIDAE